MLFLNLHFQGLVVDEIFFGLWLLPLALLVYRSRFLPRFLDIWLAINGFAWVVLSLKGYSCRKITPRCLPSLNPPFSGRWPSCCGSSSRAPSHWRATRQPYRQRPPSARRVPRTQVIAQSS
jgi:hypothetical protein